MKLKHAFKSREKTNPYAMRELAEPIRIKGFKTRVEAEDRWPTQIRRVPSCTHTMEFQELLVYPSIGASPDPIQDHVLIVNALGSKLLQAKGINRNWFILHFDDEGKIEVFRRCTMRDNRLWDQRFEEETAWKECKKKLNKELGTLGEMKYEPDPETGEAIEQTTPEQKRILDKLRNRQPQRPVQQRGLTIEEGKGLDPFSKNQIEALAEKLQAKAEKRTPNKTKRLKLRQTHWLLEQITDRTIIAEFEEALSDLSF